MDSALREVIRSQFESNEKVLWDGVVNPARVAIRQDGTLVGIRRPMAAHEQSIVRTYIAVEDIQQAVKKAEEHGATIAYPPTRQGRRGTFAIAIQGGVEHGLWQP